MARCTRCSIRELAAELVEGFLQHYREAGWIPRWSSPGFADCMVGTSSDIAFADALVKDVERGRRDRVHWPLSAMPPSRPMTPASGASRLERAIFLGYTPVEEPEGMSGRSTATSMTSGSPSMALGCLTMIVFPTTTTVRG